MAVVAGLVTAAVAVAVVPGAAPVRAAEVKIVFSVQDRSATAPGQLLDSTGIYTVDADGGHLREVAGGDGYFYRWSRWAMNGTKIVFAAHALALGPSAPDQLYVMNADGSGRRQLTSTTWTSGQPTVSPDGRFMIFTSAWPEFPKYAVYRMDLSTLLVSNLSAVGSPRGAADADPSWSPDGGSLVFASSSDDAGRVQPTQIWRMDADGRNRQQLTHDGYYNTDPNLSADGAHVVYSSYRGAGAAGAGDPSTLQTKPNDWFDVTLDLRTGAEHVLNKGLDCTGRADANRCGPADGSAFAPHWSMDGTGVAYVSALSSVTSCICMVDADGGHPRALLTTSQKIQWFDWVVPGDPPGAAAVLGADATPDELAVYGLDGEGRPVTVLARPDGWGGKAVTVPDGLAAAGDVRLSRDRESIVFSATSATTAVPPPGPAPPPGERRHVHYTLSSASPFPLAVDPPADLTARQAFAMHLDGSGVRQLTTPSTEDWMDAIPDGQWRGSSQPDASPDGRYVVVTNTAPDGESFLLRIDLRTGAVFNLTNATAGAVRVSDSAPRYSPDGRRIAFATAANGTTQIALIDAETGRNYRQVTDDTYVNLSPSWSPDGRYLVYASYRGGDPLPVGGSGKAAEDALTAVTAGWYIVRYDTQTGRKQVLTSPADSPTYSPVYSPDGTRIAYIGLSPASRQTDVFVMPSTGGTPAPLQVTLRTKELSLDWR